MKTRMKVVNSGKTREINCFTSERMYMAQLGRDLRKWHKRHGDPKPTLESLRKRAAERYL
jgi:hypothetical protein